MGRKMLGNSAKKLNMEMTHGIFSCWMTWFLEKMQF